MFIVACFTGRLGAPASPESRRAHDLLVDGSRWPTRRGPTALATDIDDCSAPPRRERGALGIGCRMSGVGCRVSGVGSGVGIDLADSGVGCRPGPRHAAMGDLDGLPFHVSGVGCRDDSPLRDVRSGGLPRPRRSVRAAPSGPGCRGARIALLDSRPGATARSDWASTAYRSTWNIRGSGRSGKVSAPPPPGGRRADGARVSDVKTRIRRVPPRRHDTRSGASLAPVPRGTLAASGGLGRLPRPLSPAPPAHCSTWNTIRSEHPGQSLHHPEDGLARPSLRLRSTTSRLDPGSGIVASNVSTGATSTPAFSGSAPRNNRSAPPGDTSSPNLRRAGVSMRTPRTVRASCAYRKSRRASTRSYRSATTSEPPISRWRTASRRKAALRSFTSTMRSRSPGAANAIGIAGEPLPDPMSTSAPRSGT